MRPVVAALIPAAVLVAVVACDPGASTTPTYHGAIKDIVERNCIDCHREGGIAPMSLQTYADVKAFGSLVASATATRTMPPVPVDVSGACRDFRDVKYVTDDEIAAIAAWAEGGFPEGDPTASVAAAAVAPRGLETVSAVLDMGEAYQPPDAARDDYRCFLVDPGNETDAYVTAYEVKPGAASVVHHVIVYVPIDDEAQAEAEALDAAEEGFGYTCYGDARVDSMLLVGWAPGEGATRFPDDTGVLLAANRKVVMQIHYNVENGTAADRTTVDLETKDVVADEAYMLLDGPGDMVLQPGLADASWTYELNTSQSARLRGIFPHMHTLGKTMRIDVIAPDGSRECMLDVPRWDFHWQRFYFYDRHVGIPAGSTVEVTCTYDTRTRDEPVYFGESTDDEMCVVGYYITLD